MRKSPHALGETGHRLGAEEETRKQEVMTAREASRATIPQILSFISATNTKESDTVQPWLLSGLSKPETNQHSLHPGGSLWFAEATGMGTNGQQAKVTGDARTKHPGEHQEVHPWPQVL